MDEKETIELVSDTGYPLQILIEDLVTTPNRLDRWSILAKEHRWADEGFADLILARDNVRLVVECKRIDGSWTFLLPTGNSSTVSMAKCVRLDTQKQPGLLTWENLSLAPSSCESAFCVMSIQKHKASEQRDSRTLEKLSGEVVLSAEHIALEEKRLILQQPGALGSNKVYVPVIVTTATLQTCKFDPRDVSIEDGKITSGKVEKTSLVRFRKGFGTDLRYQSLKLRSLYEANKEKERTVFVVQAKGFLDFLARFDI